MLIAMKHLAPLYAKVARAILGRHVHGWDTACGVGAGLSSLALMAAMVIGFRALFERTFGVDFNTVF